MLRHETVLVTILLWLTFRFTITPPRWLHPAMSALSIRRELFLLGKCEWISNLKSVSTDSFFWWWNRLPIWNFSSLHPISPAQTGSIILSAGSFDYPSWTYIQLYGLFICSGVARINWRVLFMRIWIKPHLTCPDDQWIPVPVFPRGCR